MRWLKRIGLGILALLAADILSGTAYEMWARHRIAAEFPPRGTLVDIGGRSLGDRPLFVLTAAAPFKAEDLAALQLTSEQGQRLQSVWFELHDDEASWSSQSRQVRLDDSHHYIQFERLDAVIDAVGDVVDGIRTRPGAPMSLQP